MAYPIHGKVCRVEKNSVLVSGTDGWNIDVDLDLDEKTSQGDDWKSHLAGCAEWGGSTTLIFDPSNTEQKAMLDNIVASTPGVKLTDMEFNLEDAADYISGDIFITGLSISTGISGTVKANIKFKGDSTMSLTIA